MTLTVHMHGNLRRFMPEGRDRMALEVERGTTVRALLDVLGAEADIWLVAVNGAAISRDYVLAPGDQLDCFEAQAAG